MDSFNASNVGVHLRSVYVGCVHIHYSGKSHAFDHLTLRSFWPTPTSHLPKSLSSSAFGDWALADLTSWDSDHVVSNSQCWLPLEVHLGGPWSLPTLRPYVSSGDLESPGVRHPKSLCLRVPRWFLKHSQFSSLQLFLLFFFFSFSSFPLFLFPPSLLFFFSNKNSLKQYSKILKFESWRDGQLFVIFLVYFCMLKIMG